MGCNRRADVYRHCRAVARLLQRAQNVASASATSSSSSSSAAASSSGSGAYNDDGDENHGLQQPRSDASTKRIGIDSICTSVVMVVCRTSLALDLKHVVQVIERDRAHAQHSSNAGIANAIFEPELEPACRIFMNRPVKHSIKVTTKGAMLFLGLASVAHVRESFEIVFPLLEIAARASATAVAAATASSASASSASSSFSSTSSSGLSFRGASQAAGRVQQRKKAKKNTRRKRKRNDGDDDDSDYDEDDDDEDDGDDDGDERDELADEFGNLD